MKFFDTDWSCVFHWLAVWEKLSPAARRSYLSGAASVFAEDYGSELATVVESGLAAAASPGRFKPAPASVPFRAVLAQLAKFPLFDQVPTRQLLDDYTRKHYVRDESDRIQSSWNQPAWDSLAWPKAFLNQPDVPVWEKSYLTHVEVYGTQRSRWSWSNEPKPPPKGTWFADPETIEAARYLVRAAMDSLPPLPLNSLPTLLPERLRLFLEPALKACLRYMLLYAALRKETLEAVISVCPTVVHLRSRPPAQAPRPMPCSGLASPAFLLEDMTRVLAEAATGECRLNRGGYGRRFFKIMEDKFRQDFVALPAWLGAHAEFARRLSNATGCLVGLEFAKDQHGRSGKRLLQATPKGRRWLAGSPADRLRELLFELKRHDPERVSYYDDGLELVPGQIRFGVQDPDDFDHLPWLDSIWRQSPSDGCVPVNAFLDYHARASHPLANPVVPDAFRPHLAFRYGSSRFVLREENVEEFARELLALFFWGRLVPLGCVEAGERDGGEVCFRLSGAGRFLFGLTGELVYGQPAAEAAVVVQPNFEIVFLHPNLNAEIEFAPFAERSGKGVGTLFRLTRRQAMRAASQGLTIESVLAALAKHSCKAVPANVAAELRGWFGACRSLRMRRSVLIETGDRETALRVQRLLGDRSALLGHTLIEWRGAQIDPALCKKLSEEGLFLETLSG